MLRSDCSRLVRGGILNHGYSKYVHGRRELEGVIVEQQMAATDHNLRSSYREMLLEHLFAGAVMRHIWLTSSSRVEMLKPQVDDGGYDLVLEARWHRSPYPIEGIASRRQDSGGQPQSGPRASKQSGCVIWMQFDPHTLAFDHFLWFGGQPGKKASAT